MSNKVLQLEGIYEPSKPDDGLLNEWRREKRKLEDEMRELRQQRDDLEISKQRLERSVQNLRQQLTPLHRALRALFGEIELTVGEEHAAASVPGSPPAAASSDNSRWESYKQNFPGAPAQIIEALLAHQSMTYMQLSKLLRRDYNTIKNAAARLREAGAIVKEGTMCRLNR